MPLFDLQCSTCNHTDPDRYIAAPRRGYGACPRCGGILRPLITGAPVPLTKTFGEDRERVDLHIRPDGKPQVITSWEQRRKLMRQFNLEDADPRPRRR